MKSIGSLTCVAVLLSVASLAFADLVGGPSGGVTRVEARGVNVHKVLYRGGEQADFKIAGDGFTILNLVVRDANGNVVVRTSGPGDKARTTWIPAQTGYFYISVINEGGAFNQYNYLAY